MPDVYYSVDFYYNGAWVSGQLRRHAVHDHLPDESVRPDQRRPQPQRRLSSTATTIRKTTSRSPPRAFIPAAATSPSPTARSASSRRRSTAGPTIPPTGKPTNVSYDSTTCLFSVTPAQGVYQALSTRARRRDRQRGSVLIRSSVKRSTMIATKLHTSTIMISTSLVIFISRSRIELRGGGGARAGGSCP